MTKEEVKKYEKPKVTRVPLDAKCAVLGFCKQAGIGNGPTSTGCVAGPTPCFAQGS